MPEAPRAPQLAGRFIAPVQPSYERSKRLLDLSLALLLLPLIAPIVALCGVLIRAHDGGPVFFKQPRTGRGGHQFPMYKLRTMIPDAHERKAEFLHLNQATGPDFKLEDDPRVTPIGRLLRKASIDELPQLWNVLKGEMSFVGPRPTSFSADTYDLWHTERLEVVPGITGLWQISRRGDTDFDERVRLDVEYIAKRGMLFDAEILLRTLGAIALRRGAF